MTYELEFYEDALKEWKKSGVTIREQFKKKLQERLENPEIESARLSGAANRFKIKLRSSGYRLVYEVKNDTLTVLVVAVGKRERNQVYKIASKRL